MTLAGLAAGATELGLSLNEDQLEQFARYRALLLEWNQRLNLTAIVEPSAVEIRHFLDSLSCLLVTGPLTGRRLIDVGTGAGFPGLPLKIVTPDLRVTLLDSVAKKTTFLQAVVAELALADVEIVAARAETVGRDPVHRERYDWAAARSVAHLRVLAEYLLPLVRVGGAALAMKGEDVGEELATAEAALGALGGGQPSRRAVTLPGVQGQHQLVVIPKQAATPMRYPRRPGMPAKRPL